MSTEEKINPTAADFVECTTRAGTKRHVVERLWKLRTLCGLTGTTNFSRDWLATIEPCKQCDKSRTRRMEGRPS